MVVTGRERRRQDLFGDSAPPRQIRLRYRAERYDLSVAMGEERVLAPAVRAIDEDTEIVATGTWCRHQIADLTGRKAVHPVDFLATRLL